MKKIWVITAFTVLNGCVNPASTTLPEEFIYPTVLINTPHEQLATIQGTMQESVGCGMTKQRLLIKQIDGKLTPAKENRWNQQWPLLAGEHTLLVEFGMGLRSVPVILRFTAQPQQHYQIACRSNYGTWRSGKTYTDFWIINSVSGEIASAPVRGLHRNLAPVPVFMPINKSK